MSISGLSLGCGDGAALGPDAGPANDRADAASDDRDAATPDASGEPGPVTITVALDGQLAPDLPVVFQNADDSVVAIETTDASGTATATMAPGGSLSLIIARPGHDSILSVLGVRPGDHIRFGRPDPVFSEIDLLLPPTSEPNPRYVVLSRCGGSFPLPTTPNARFRRLDGCTNADVVVGLAQNGLPFQDYGAFAVANVDLSGSVIDLSAAPFAPPTPVSLTLTNTPPTIIGGDTGLAATTPTAGVWLQGGVGDSIARYEGAITPTANDTAKIPDIGASHIQARTNVLFTSAQGRTSVLYVYETVAVAATYALDIASLSIPIMTQPATLDASAVVTWSQTAGAADWIEGYFRSRRETTVLDRIVWAPHQGSSLALPVLPEPHAAHNPRPGDSPEILYFRLADGPGGYDAYRNFDGDRVLFERSLWNAGERIVYSSVL